MITEYHRPATLDEAVVLVGLPGASVIAEATGPRRTENQDATVAIDLQSLGLDGIATSGDVTNIGSMTTLADLAASPLSPPTIAELATREYPITLRNAATVGGVIATNDAESELLAGLVAFGASVQVARADTKTTHALETILAEPPLIDGSIIVDVSISTLGVGAAHRTGRTPMDRPIVMVVGHRGSEGQIRLAATGVDSHVVAVSESRLDDLQPPADFRGSAGYRKTLVKVLTSRVLEDLSRSATR